MASHCGCFHWINIGTYANKKYIPQVEVAAHTIITSTASRTVLTQTFINGQSTEDNVECIYTFPLYDGVSVIGFKCYVGSRTIEGVVKEKAEARASYENAIERGEKASLLEQGPTSDVFETTLGNVQPGEKLRVEITFVGELKHDIGMGGIRFTLPTVISPRYQADQLDIDQSSASAKGFEVTVDITMPKECPIREVRSPSHPIALTLGRTSSLSSEEPIASRASVNLSLGSVVLDKDFVLEISYQDVGKPRALSECHPKVAGQRALMVTLVPQTLPNKGLKPEVIIVADQSGSMQGGRTKTLVSALRVLLKSLPVGLTFNVCAFGSSHRLLWDQSRIYDDKTLAEALAFVSKFSGDYGGTETLSAVRAAIESRNTSLNLSMILATDGDIWGQQELFSYINEQVATSKNFIRTFAIGIGNSVSSGLIEGIARAGNGFALTVGEKEKQDSKIVRMLKGALTPDSGSFTMEVQYENGQDEEDYVLIERVTDSLRVMMVNDEAAPDAQLENTPAVSAKMVTENVEEDKLSEESNPRKSVSPFIARPPKLLQAPSVVPPLYPFSRTTIYVLSSPSSSNTQPKSVIFRSGSPDNVFEITIPVENMDQPGTTIHCLAAKRAILELEEGRGWLSHAKDHSGTLLRSVHKEAFEKIVEAECVRLGVQHQIASKYTSFVAVETNGSDSTASRVIQPSKATVLTNGHDRLATASADPRIFPLGGRTTQMPRKSKGCMQPHMQIAARAAVIAAPVAPITLAASRGSMSSLVPSGRRVSGLGGGSLHHRKIGNPSNNSDDDSDMEAKGNEKDPLQDIIGLQTFVGYWDFDEKLIRAVGIPTDHKAPDAVWLRVWATILAITFLESKLAQDKETWEMIVEKGRDWMEGEVAEDDEKMVDLWFEDARKLFSGA